MITAMSLADDDEAINAITSGYSDAEVSSQGLKANLQYLGSKAQGKIARRVDRAGDGDHRRWLGRQGRQESVHARPTRLAATPLRLDRARRQGRDRGGGPHAHRSRAANECPPWPRTDPHCCTTTSTRTWPAWSATITAAHAEADLEVSSTKKRRTKPFGSKVDVPRNRSVVSHYVADATAMGLGGNRAADAAAHLNFTINGLKPLADADFRGNEAASVKSLLSQLNSERSADRIHGVDVPGSTRHRSARRVEDRLPRRRSARHGDHEGQRLPHRGREGDRVCQEVQAAAVGFESQGEASVGEPEMCRDMCTGCTHPCRFPRVSLRSQCLPGGHRLAA